MTRTSSCRQAGLFVVVSTLALTALFLGIVALITGGVSGLTNRLPFQALALASEGVAFTVRSPEQVASSR